MIGQGAQRERGGVTEQNGSYRMMRRLLIIGLVALVLLVIAWWRYNSELSQAASIPPPVVKTSVVSPVPAVTTVPTPNTPSASQAPAPITKTQLQINGKTVPVPASGTVDQTIQSPDGTSTVHFSTNSTSSGSNDSSTSTDIQIDSTSNSSSQVVTNETH
jgi:hypothetical protein